MLQSFNTFKQAVVSQKDSTSGQDDANMQSIAGESTEPMGDVDLDAIIAEGNFDQSSTGADGQWQCQQQSSLRSVLYHAK